LNQGNLAFHGITCMKNKPNWKRMEDSKGGKKTQSRGEWPRKIGLNGQVRPGRRSPPARPEKSHQEKERGRKGRRADGLAIHGGKCGKERAFGATFYRAKQFAYEK